MPLTREFKETVQARLRLDRKYRKELLREGVECLLAGDLEQVIEMRDLQKIAGLIVQSIQDHPVTLLSSDPRCLHQGSHARCIDVRDVGQVYVQDRRLSAQHPGQRGPHFARVFYGDSAVKGNFLHCVAVRHWRLLALA